MLSTLQAMRAAALAIVVSATAGATPVGTLSFGGQAEITFSSVDFTPFLVGEALNGAGRVTILGDGDGVFSSLSQFNPQNGGTIKDRSAIAGQPAGEDINIPEWLQFDDPGFQYVLYLRYISPGTYSSAECGAAVAVAGQTCTPDLAAPLTSPYNLANFISASGRMSSSASFAVNGVLRHKVTGSEDYKFDGVIGAEFLGRSYQSVLSQLLANNNTGRVIASYSGTLEVTVVPEPSTALLAGVGVALILFGCVRRRRA